MKNWLLSSVVAAVGLVAVSGAKADTFTYGSFTLNGAQPVTITSPVSQTVFAGQIDLHGAGANAGQDLLVWCLDLLTNLLPGPYTYQIDPLTTAGAGFGNPTLTTTQITEIGDLMKFGNSGTDPDLAATQLAIWKIEYPGFATLGLSSTLQK